MKTITVFAVVLACVTGCGASVGAPGFVEVDEGDAGTPPAAVAPLSASDAGALVAAQDGAALAPDGEAAPLVAVDPPDALAPVVVAPPAPVVDAGHVAPLGPVVYPVRCQTASKLYTCDGTTTGGYGYALDWYADGVPTLCSDPGALACARGARCEVSNADATIEGTCL